MVFSKQVPIPQGTGVIKHIVRQPCKIHNLSQHCQQLQINTSLNQSFYPKFSVCQQSNRSQIIALCQDTDIKLTKAQEYEIEQKTSGDGSGLPPSDKNGYGGDDEGDDRYEDESGFESDGDELLNLAQAEQIAQTQGVKLPNDFMTTAQGGGLRAHVLARYIEMQSIFFTGFLMRTSPWFRDRLLVDSRFLFKVLAEITIDSGCATMAEIQKRGSDFWSEFEFYLSDMVVGIVMDIVLVGLLAPTAVLGARVKPAQTPLQKLLQKVPSAIFAPSVPGGRHYTIEGRLACFLVKGLEYSLAGMTCGFVGQGIANSCMYLRRQMKGGMDEDDVPIPPLIKTALVWGMFMGLSSNVRYQIVYGLERMVEVSIARKVPQVAYGTTIAIRLINNFIGGMNFIDMARWAGVQ
eukprot:TRINITY_DN4094_c0_g1_i1.p1 TRINITY_DN4094_c0_g1~~TRINITY_DN4094_c0_g1_i1.p1  ORF type:complete len:435 (+),score=36.43 TRINITY_DN4094_c0_g1_i1:90-1307(+)